MISKSSNHVGGLKKKPRAQGPAAQLPSAERQTSGPDRVSKRRRISIPLIRPSENADKPAPRVVVDQDWAEINAKRWGVHQQSIQEAMEKKMEKGKTNEVKSPSSPSEGPIHKDMLISDIMLQYPESLELLIAAGLHCIGCTLSAYDTLEGGCAIHGMDEETVAGLIKEMNHKVKDEAAKKQTDTSKNKKKSKTAASADP